ncbi:MAG: hypothetical protein V2A61_02930 [Calditrichota bacterium]
MNKRSIVLMASGASLILLTVIWLHAGTIDSKPIKFSHARHASEASLACGECHKDPGKAAAGQRPMPRHAECESCHDVTRVDNCGQCHLNPANPLRMPSPSINYADFAHKTHLAANISCVVCHGAQVNSGAEPTLPVMSDCQRCHLQAQAPLACERCHQGQRPQPVDHQLGSWPQDHGLEARLQTSDCSACHAPQTCDQCHQGINLYGTPHPPTWIFNHFAESSFGGECLSCHETRRFCVDCHRVSLPPPHGFGLDYANPQTGGAHATDAESFPETCLSCHDVGNADPTCARCHERR